MSEQESIAKLWEASNAALREENDLLREAVRQLREQLVPQIQLPPSWRMNRQEAILLVCLMRCAPRVATREHIIAALYPYHNPPNSVAKIIEVLVCGCRKRLRAAGLRPEFQSVKCIGYVMTAAERDRLLGLAGEAGRQAA